MGTQDARHQRLPAVLDFGEAPPANANGPASANDEAHGSCGCKKNVQDCPAALVEATEQLGEGCNRQFVEPSPDRLREVVEIHGAAQLVMVSPEQTRTDTEGPAPATRYGSGDPSRRVTHRSDGGIDRPLRYAIRAT